MLNTCGCGLTTDGQHRINCPSYVAPIRTVSFPSIPQGWECPRCHKILNPAVNECSCSAAPSAYELMDIGSDGATYEIRDVTVIY